MTLPTIPRRGRPVLRLERVQQSYSIDGLVFPVLEGVDMEIHRGDVAVVTGAAGAGKSSLLNLLGGLERPTGGKLDLLGHDVRRLDDCGLANLRRRRIGVVPQVFTLAPDLTARQIVAAARHGGRAPDPGRLLELVGLPADDTRPARHLDPDARRRLLVARAMMRDPELLVCDLRRDVCHDAAADAAARVNRALGTTVVLVSRGEGWAGRADVRVELDRGRVAELPAAGRAARVTPRPAS